ncbi:Collagen alpha-2(V) chain [Tyrophagus putrescentiae]|nr:Collagen alpha-2(V) chain [Tyrophagus putrescentiae]
MALTAFLDLEEVVECVAKLEKLGNLEKMALEAFLEVRALASAKRALEEAEVLPGVKGQEEKVVLEQLEKSGNLARKGAKGERGDDGRRGKPGSVGVAGDRGYPGEPYAYDAHTLAILLANSATKGPSSSPPEQMLSDEPIRLLTSEETPIEEKERLILDAYELMIEEWNALNRRPNGSSPQSAGLTCATLFEDHPSLPSGHYFIDPNEGSTPLSRNGHSWYSELAGGGKMFEYRIPPVQLTFLQLLSNSATQNLTYLCRGSVAYFDAGLKSHDKAVKLLTYDEQELVAVSGVRSAVYSVTFDVHSPPGRLPLLDIGVRDIGGSNQQFGLIIGRVCFV